MSPADDIVIASVTAMEELRRVEALQREVWGMPERDVVPSHQLLAATGAGGLVLGAYDRGGRMVGFCYGFVGLREGRPLFYSHMAGVLDAYRGRNIGLRLKRAQRDAALARGLERMVWTYDPLQSANAHLNLHKLGARASRYYLNYYGEMPDELNRGIPSDRLEVDWWLQEPHVERLMAGDPVRRDPPDAPPPALAARGSGAYAVPGEPDLSLDADAVRIEIPVAFTDIRTADLPLAQAWRMATRQAFQQYLGRGYDATDFRRSEPPRGRVGAYILQKHRGEEQR